MGPNEHWNPRALSGKYAPPDTRVQDQADKVNALGAHDIDHRASRTPMRVVDNGASLTFRLDVLNEGTMEMKVTAEPATGKLIYNGMRLVIEGVK